MQIWTHIFLTKLHGGQRFLPSNHTIPVINILLYRSPLIIKSPQLLRTALDREHFLTNTQRFWTVFHVSW